MKYYSEQNRKKRGKRKKKNYFLNIVIVILVLLGLWFIAFRSGIFDVREIHVQNNMHYTSSEVIERAGVNVGDNIFKVRTSGIEEALEKDPYIQSAVVTREFPDGLRIELAERIESAVVSYDEGNAVLDYDGTILRITDDPPELPVITGLTPENPVPGQAMVIAETGLLEPGLKFIEYVEQNDFYFKRLELGSVIPRAYVFDQLVIEGELKNIEKGIEEIKRVIADLDSKNIVRGTISVGSQGSCSFTPEIRA